MMEHLQDPQHFSALERHHRMCIVKESHTCVTCKFCGIKMHSTIRMKRHHECRHADKVAEVQEALKVKPVEYNMHKCPICEKAFRAKSVLQLHFLKTHKKRAVFNCKICKRGFLDQRRLDNHLRTRYHAKRVIALNLSNQAKENMKDSRRNKNFRANRFNRKLETGKNLEQKSSNVSFTGEKFEETMSTSKSETKNNPSESMTKNLPTRRSTRKRKKKEFSDQEDSDEESHIQKGKKSSRKGKNSLKMRIGLKSKTVTLNVEDKCDKRESTVKSSHDGGSARNALKVKNTTVKQNRMHLEQACLDIDSKKIENKELIQNVISQEQIRNVKQTDDVDEETLLAASKHVFSCIYCDFAASDLIELRSHYNESHPNDILTCQPCNQYFLSLKAYKIHCSGRGHQLKLREEMGETVMHKCPVCDKRFLQESCCALHVETVHRHPSCEADLQRIHKGQDLVTQLYGDHVAQVENLCNDSSVSCPECGKFVRKDTLVEHLRLHTGERPYTCRFCPKSFAGRLTLRRHISSHLNMPLFMCDTCGKEFKRNTHLVKHIRQHDSEKKGEKHTCQVCKVWFYIPEELERHMKRHGERTFKCTWPGCQWTFVLSGELKSHMHTHTKEKKYLCDMCGFGAPTKTRLRRHSRIHDKSRSFKCDYCPYKATCKTHLRRHMRIHINSKPFACPYCSYTCNTHENIRKHILKTQKHKGKKLYPCKLCTEFSCDSSRDFKAHLMTVHAKYLRENAIDSLAVFSGLYKREEDLQVPQEGAEILQVTKGRFYKHYQNPDQPQPKQVKPNKAKRDHEKCDVKVRIVPPSELDLDGSTQEGKEKQEGKGPVLPIVNKENSLKEQIQPEQQPSFEKSHKIVIDLQSQRGPEQQVQHQIIVEPQATSQPQLNVGVTQDNQTAQYITVPNLLIQSSYASQNEQLLPVTLSTQSMDQQVQNQQNHPNQNAASVPISDSDKVFWAVEFSDPHAMDVATPTSAVTHDPWYSGIPQVHAPSTQDLGQFRAVEGAAMTQSNFLPGAYLQCSLPSGPIYASENTVVVLENTNNSITSGKNSGL